MSILKLTGFLLKERFSLLILVALQRQAVEIVPILIKSIADCLNFAGNSVKNDTSWRLAYSTFVTSFLTFKKMEETQFYVGMWVTKDGYIRHELLPNGRYDEARGNRQSAYQGKYIITDNHIDYVDDTGFTADGDFKNGILYHAGMVLYKE